MWKQHILNLRSSLNPENSYMLAIVMCHETTVIQYQCFGRSISCITVLPQGAANGAEKSWGKIHKYQHLCLKGDSHQLFPWAYKR